MIDWHADHSDKFIGTTAALIMGGIAAAGSIAGAKIQSNAAKDAATTQSDAAKQAMAYQQQATDRALGYIGQERGNALVAPTYSPPGNPAQGSAAYGTLGRGMGLWSNAGPSFQPPSMPAWTHATPAAAAPQPGAPSGPTGPFTGGAPNPGLVMLEAPDGTQRAVPRDQVPHYLQRGARMVGGSV